jgi:hypothetical protein
VKAGEEWQFSLESGEIEEFLETYGFSLAEHRDAAELERMYFTDPSGEVVGRINGTHCIVRATKPDS